MPHPDVDPAPGDDPDHAVDGKRKRVNDQIRRAACELSDHHILPISKENG